MGSEAGCAGAFPLRGRIVAPNDPPMADSPRTILHADMDAFYAAIEQRDRPELRGKPVIVGGSGPRQVVATASYEARAFGVRSAMPGVRAKQLCPHGVFVAPRMDAYVAVSRQVQDVFSRYTDRVEPLSLDEAFLDATGCEPLFGDGEAIARAIRRDVQEATQLTVSVGVASSKFVAKVASDVKKPNGLVVVKLGEERAFLAPLPITRLWGVGEKTAMLLRQHGLLTIGDAQRVAREDLVRWFGDNLGNHVHDLAHGLDAREVEPEREAKSIGHEMTFERDLITHADADATLLQLCEMVGRRLRKDGRSARCVRLKLRLFDFSTTVRQRSVSPTQDDLVLYAAAKELLQQNWNGRAGIRLLGVTAAQLAEGSAAVQQSLFEPARDQKGLRVLRALDAIRDRHGEDAVHRGMAKRSTTPWGPGVE